jgi:ATP-binding cassette subfamily F protein uup
MLDEPTNDLDIQTLVRLEEYLDSFAGCLIVVSHDRYFLDRTVESIFRFEGNGHVKEYPGNYSAFLESSATHAASLRRERETPETIEGKTVAQKRTPSSGTSTGTSAGPMKLSYKERREFEELEKRIELNEARKAELERVLSAPSSDFVAVEAAYVELQVLNRELENDVDRWATLAELA